MQSIQDIKHVDKSDELLAATFNSLCFNCKGSEIVKNI